MTGLFSARRSGCRNAVFYVLALLPPLYILYLITRYGIDVPFWDQWEFVLLLKKFKTGALSFPDLWAQHNEHRILFPKLIMLVLAAATGWDIRYEFYANFFLAGLTFVFLNLLSRKEAGGRCAPWFSVVSAFLVFSPVQVENWTWGWQIQIFLGVLGAVVAVWSVSRWPAQWKGLIVAMGAALLASYSFNNGLLTWPVVGILLLAQGQWKMRHIGLWAAAFIISVFLYYHGYQKPELHPSLLYPLNHPYDYIRYVFAYLGSPLAFSKREHAIVIGILLTCILCIASVQVWRSGREGFQRLLPWLALALYSILSAAVTGIGRLGFGVDQAMSGRYTTISTPFAVSVFVVAAYWIGDYLDLRKRLPGKLMAVVCFVSILFVFSYASSFSRSLKKFARTSAGMQKAKLCLEDPGSAEDACLKILYPDTAIVRERAKMLMDMGILKWSRTPVPLSGKEGAQAP